VNCIQAQAMLAAYRDLKNEEVNTLELDVHLEQCASCRQVLARYSFIGEQVRSLPIIEPPPQMHDSLMRALAKEQLWYIQRSAPGTFPTPEFLTPYLTERATTRIAPQHIPDSINTFSTAETGPLPIIHAKRKRRSLSQVNQFAVVGIAAMFLMLLMMGGITSLLLLAHGNSQVANTVNTVGSKAVQTIVQQSDLTQLKYTTTTPYQHVASAVADDNYIYYTAYRDGANNGWMLEQLNRTTRQTTDLLPKASTNVLVVLGAANGWLIWLQYDNPKSVSHENVPDAGVSSKLQPWSLHYLNLKALSTTTNAKSKEPPALLKGVFNHSTAPLWVSTPVQGVWFIQNSLLVATIDDNGFSHLLRYDLGNASDTGSTPPVSMKEIATASVGGVFTSPTANSDGSNIFWSEEWLSKDGNLHSNIWVQRVLDTPTQTRGKVPENTVPTTELYRSDGLSFRPQVADNTLFLLSASPATNSTHGTLATTTPLNIASVPRIDTSIYAESLDNFIQGTVLMIPLDGASVGIPTSLGMAGQSSALQAGNDFALWQDNDGYKMYDVQKASDVIVGGVLSGANFVAVNGNTTVWTAGAGTPTPNAGVGLSTTLLAFNWAK
jgi:hypothetical protein